jgi:hypothetical protein
MRSVKVSVNGRLIGFGPHFLFWASFFLWAKIQKDSKKIKIILKPLIFMQLCLKLDLFPN